MSWIPSKAELEYEKSKTKINPEIEQFLDTLEDERRKIEANSWKRFKKAYKKELFNGQQ